VAKPSGETVAEGLLNKEQEQNANPPSKQEQERPYVPPPSPAESIGSESISVSRMHSSGSISTPWAPSQSLLALKSNAWNDGLACIMKGDAVGLKQYSSLVDFQRALSVWRNRAGESILHILCKRGSSGVLSVLLEDLPNKSLVNTGRARETGMLPLHAAAAAGHPQCVRLLITKGNAKVRDQFDCYGLTPLHRAAICLGRNADQCARLLLEAGSDLLTKDQSDQSAWHKAVFHGNLPVLLVFEKWVLEHSKPKETSIGEEEEDQVQGEEGEVEEPNMHAQLLKNDRFSAFGKTSLHLAAKYVGINDPESPAAAIITLLAQRMHFDINSRSMDSGYTPLHDAAVAGNEGAVKALLAAGADINARVRTSLETPLHLAVTGGHTESVRVLLSDAEVEPSLADASGTSPQKLAVKRNQKDIIDLFTDTRIALAREADRKARGQAMHHLGEDSGAPRSFFTSFSMNNKHDKLTK
jgi:ankyrin repeat protein